MGLLGSVALSSCGGAGISSEDRSPEPPSTPSVMPGTITSTTLPTTESTITPSTGSTPASTASPGSTPAPSSPRVPEGFDTVVVSVTSAEGEVCELCLWLADDDERRRRGLMFVDDLGPADGMAFVYDAPRTTAFTMRNTVLPLTIVFHGADGRHLDAFDMEPCRAEPCPSYPTPEGFTVAIEVEQGRAEEFGLGPGSMLEILSVGGPDGCAFP